MGFWKIFFGKELDPAPAAPAPGAIRPPGDAAAAAAALAQHHETSATLPAGLQGDGKFGLPLVGESQYQENLAAAAGGRRSGGCDVIVTATLVLEDSNRYDALAVRVDVGGNAIGYLTRDKARKYRGLLATIGQPRLEASCRARIICGPQEPDGGRRLFGAWLDLDLRKRRRG